MPLLYDAVAVGMWAYSRSVFRVRTLGRERLCLEAGTLIVSTHRRETDVPLVCPSIYFGPGGLLTDRSRRMSFAAREDLFVPGFFAGFPPELPLRLRRLLFPLAIDPYLRDLTLFPIRSAAVVRLEEVFRRLPELELADALPPDDLEALRKRALQVGLPEPRLATEVVRGEYADLLWRSHTRDELDAPALEPVWSQRASDAVRDFRELVDVVSRGAILLIFPEGRPSPDGEIGPLQRGLASLVRRAKPSALQPVGLAYDPLVRGRTHAFVSVGDPLDPPQEAFEETMLSALRLATPLTCGQVVASWTRSGRHGTAGAVLEAAIERAVAEGRNVDPELLQPRSRKGRLRLALASADALPDDDPGLAFLAREHESARALGAS
jgi:1-acyl-sn-glycerol-3-phosphate acyltransferase